MSVSENRAVQQPDPHFQVVNNACSRIAVITAILDAASVTANAVAEGHVVVADRTLPDLLEHGYQLALELRRDIEESA